MWRNPQTCPLVAAMEQKYSPSCHAPRRRPLDQDRCRHAWRLDEFDGQPVGPRDLTSGQHDGGMMWSCRGSVPSISRSCLDLRAGTALHGHPDQVPRLGYRQPHLVVPHNPLPAKGWICRINTNGLPEWIPPRWIDQDQTPQLNTRIRRLHAQSQQRRPRRRSATAA